MPISPYKVKQVRQATQSQIPDDLEIDQFKGRKYLKSVTTITSQHSIRSIREYGKVTFNYNDDGDKLINQFLILKDIGRGSFAKIKLVLNTENNQKYVNLIALKPKAMKCQNRKFLRSSLISKEMKKSLEKEMKLEMEIMKQIDHPNLVRLHEVIDDPQNKKIYLVMDYMDKGAIG